MNEKSTICLLSSFVENKNFFDYRVEFFKRTAL